MVRMIDAGGASTPSTAIEASPEVSSRVGRLSVAVVGAGRMGANHVWALRDIEGASLATVCDANEETASRTAKNSGLDRYYTSVEEMLDHEKLDAAIVATSTQYHCEVALRCIEAGVHVLVEKPMASSVEQCLKLVRAAESHNVRLMIGHVERFNPAICQVKSFLDQGLIGGLYCVETVRSGPFPRRLYGGKDGVIIDLAVHDLDLVHYLAGGITQIYAHAIETGSNRQEVFARVMFRTEREVLGSSEFSWISPRRARTVSIYGDKGILLADLQDQEVWYFENGDAGTEYGDNYYQNVLWGRVSEGKVIKFPIRREDALRKEISYFCDLICNPEMAHDPSYGIEALSYSLAALRSARRDEIIYFDGKRREA